MRRAGPRSCVIRSSGCRARACGSRSCRAAAAEGSLSSVSDGELGGNRRALLERLVEHDFLVGVGLLEQAPNQQIVEPVAALEAAELGDQAGADELEVPERVEHLVAHELVAELEPRL